MEDLIKTIVVPAIGLIGALAGWAYRDLRTSMSKINESIGKQAEKFYSELETIRSQVQAWQLETVRGFATKDELERLDLRLDKIEGKVAEGFDRLADKIDKMAANK